MWHITIRKCSQHLISSLQLSKYLKHPRSAFLQWLNPYLVLSARKNSYLTAPEVKKEVLRQILDIPFLRKIQVVSQWWKLHTSHVVKYTSSWISTCGGVEVALHKVELGHLDDPDWESTACTTDHFWDLCGLHNEEQTQPVYKWCVQGHIWPWMWDTDWKHAWETLLETAGNLQGVLPAETCHAPKMV